MNRLSHLRKTLEKNIQDNYLLGQVEFVLLDYNSTDGLEKWVRSTMQKYIDQNILIYYRTTEPQYYQRSHSRNMAFRLATGNILCNLDADNFLGKGFASFMLKAFDNDDKVFYTNNYTVRDVFGRFCARSNDFMYIRGYNEALKGYGFEDADIFSRLLNKGLTQKCFNNPEFYHYVPHSYSERISEEQVNKKVKYVYISYINPYTSNVLLFNNDKTLEQYMLTANCKLNILTEYSSINESAVDERNRVVVHGGIIKAKWDEGNYSIAIQSDNYELELMHDNMTFDFNGLHFYRVKKDMLRAQIISLITDGLNYTKATKQMENKSVVNAGGFGRGFVYKNFDLSHKLVLS